MSDGAGPIQFNNHFGDTAALLLALAGPRETDLEFEIRTRDIRAAIEAERADAPASGEERFAIVVVLPRAVDPDVALCGVSLFGEFAAAEGGLTDPQVLLGPGYVGLNAAFEGGEQAARDLIASFLKERLGHARFHEDAWAAAVIGDLADTLAELEAVRGAKYSHHQLDQFFQFLADGLLTVPLVSKVDRSGFVDQQVTLSYDQQRLASYGVNPYQLSSVLDVRNTPTSARSI